MVVVVGVGKEMATLYLLDILYKIKKYNTGDLISS